MTSLIVLSESMDNMTAMLIEFRDGVEHNSPIIFLPGPSQIPEKFRPRPESQEIFILAYLDNAKNAGFSLQQTKDIRNNFTQKKRKSGTGTSFL